MAITIAIIGRPNVGKSTLFNHLTRSRNALVSDQPGVTRDRHYGFSEYADRNFIFIDTGGLFDPDENDLQLSDAVAKQVFMAVAEADLVFWLVDGRAGVTSLDEELAARLRRVDKPVYLLVNKTEGLDPYNVTAEFHALASGVPIPVSAKRGTGIPALMDRVSGEVPMDPSATAGYPTGLRISIVGRPNVGKSTLTNRLLGEERVLTYEHPGTTRDSISAPFSRQGKNYVLMDTAGIRRRARVNDKIEKFSVLKSLEAMAAAQVVILVIDAREGLTEQDLSILGMTATSGKSLIIAVNKWDGLDAAHRQSVRQQLDRRLGFADYGVIHFISALHGTGIGKVFQTIEKIRRVQMIDIKPSRLTGILEEAVTAHQPPLIRGRRIKLRYAHLGGHDPLRIIIHGNQTAQVPAAYQRFLSNTFRQRLNLIGTPVLIELRSGENPFKGKKNTLTRGQAAKRRRLMRHVKKK